MPRSIWNGTITFGMVNVPIKLYSATESKSVHFQEAHITDGARIEHRRICPKEEREVPKEELVMGFEVARATARAPCARTGCSSRPWAKPTGWPWDAWSCARRNTSSP
jgi:hypothetical protein